MTDLPGVEPHGKIEMFADDIFYVTGSVVMMPLMRLPRNMTIIRSGGELTVINAVRLNDETRKQLESLGQVKNVVRIGMHGMDDAWYVQEFGAHLWALPGVKHARGQVTTQELSPDNMPFAESQLFAFEHTKLPEAAILYTGHGGVLITCDSVQNWVDTTGCSWPAAVVTKMFGFVKPAQIGPPWRKVQTKPGGSLKPDFDRLVALDFKHLIGGHGVPLRDEAQARLADTIARELG